METPPSNGVGHTDDVSASDVHPPSVLIEATHGAGQTAARPDHASVKLHRSTFNRKPMLIPAKANGSTLTRKLPTRVHLMHRTIGTTRPFIRAQSRETQKFWPGLRQRLVPAEQYASESNAKHWPGLRQKLVPAEQFATESDAQYDKRSATRQTTRSSASDRKLSAH